MTTRTVEDLLSQGQAARGAARQVARLSTQVKNQTLNTLAGLLEGDIGEVLQANAEDCAEARDGGLNEAMIDRLLLTPERLLGGVSADYGEIPGFPGVWANTDTLEECRQELKEVLEGWITLGIERGHEIPALPSMGNAL